MTLLDGTCLVGGKHPINSVEWRQCPLRHAAARSERSRKAAQARWKRRQDSTKHADDPSDLRDARSTQEGSPS